MTARELDRLQIIQSVIDGNLKPGRAAERLGMTGRQLRRLVTRVCQEGPAGIVSKRSGRPSNNRTPAELTQQALDFICDRYTDFGSTLACEKLLECHGIRIGTETARKLMTEAGLWTPRRLRSPAIYQPRNRRHRIGELIQIDGSDHTGWSRNCDCGI